MSNLSASIEIPIQCPQCGHTLKKRLSELEHKHSITCTCGVVFDVDPSGFKSARQSLDKLSDTLRKLGK